MIKKKILFINAIHPLVEVETRYPNLGLAYLISSLRKHFKGDILDFKIIEKDIEKEIESFSPDLIEITAVSQNFNLAKSYAKLIKTKKIPVIVGGTHISVLPNSLSEDMDIGCLGEGEQTVVELVDLFLKNGKFSPQELKKIKGICYWENNKIIINEPRPLIENLDTLPLPARDLLKIEKHSYIFSSRGCPYRCIFCASSRYWQKVRLFSAEYIVKEIKELVEKYQVNLISFFDDLFIIDKERIKKIIYLLKKENLYGKVKFTCSGRANLLNEEVAGLLKEMGVFSVGMGLESGSEKTLKYLKGGSVTVKDNINAIRVLKKYGIAAAASFVIGSPQETKEEIFETYEFIKNNPLDLADAYLLIPLPGTPLWEYAKNRGLVSDDDNMDWDLLNVNFSQNHEKTIILSETLNREELWKIYKKFQRLCRYKKIKSIYRHPYRQDIFKFTLKIFFQKINSLFRK